MVPFEPDTDDLRCSLQICYDNCVTRYETDSSMPGYVREGYNEPETTYVDNDAVIAQVFQDELSRVEVAEASGYPNLAQPSIVEQEWSCQPVGHDTLGQEHRWEAFSRPDRCENEINVFDKNDNDYECSSTGTRESENSVKLDNSATDETLADSVEIEDDFSGLDGEFEKRLKQMVPVPHVPKINGELPSEDEKISDHGRLLQRLQMFGLVEKKIEGDGNCQFRSLSDQLYRTSEHHESVREQVVHQLKSDPETYESYVPMAYNTYLENMSKSGEWGDHVTLQAAADWFGVRILVITSFKDTCYIEIRPQIQKSNRLVCVSFWAEVHYNSIYPEEEMAESKGKKKKWWDLSL